MCLMVVSDGTSSGIGLPRSSHTSVSTTVVSTASVSSTASPSSSSPHVSASTPAWLRMRNPYGPFRLYESLQDQLNRLSGLRESEPSFAAALMQQGQLLIRLAIEGNLDSIDKLVAGSEEGELLFWYNAKMFNAACVAGHVDVVKFMVCNGLDIKSMGVVNALHVAAHGTTDASAVEVCTTLVEAGYDVNKQRSDDLFSPLHIACRRGHPDLIRALVRLGADVNSVAKGDRMPLGVLQYRRDCETDDAKLEDLDAALADLKRRGASTTWRTKPVVHPPAAPLSSSPSGARSGRVLDFSTQ